MTDRLGLSRPSLTPMSHQLAETKIKFLISKFRQKKNGWVKSTVTCWLDPVLTKNQKKNMAVTKQRLVVRISLVLMALHCVQGEVTQSSAESTTTLSSPSSTATTPKLDIKCLNNDCGNTPLTKINQGSLPRKNLILSNMMPVASSSSPTEEVTSVPRKGVDNMDSAPTVPKKGVVNEHHSQSAKKELKDLARTTAAQNQTTTVTTPSTTSISSTTTNDQIHINSEKSVNLNVIATTNPANQPHFKPDVTKDEQDFMPQPPGGEQPQSISTSLVVGLVFALVLMTVLLFVGLKRIESIRRRREYRRMNDFLIDGMYNDL